VNTGKVRFVYKNFAILGVESMTAAEAGECAEDQGKFWELHDAIYADQVQDRTILNADVLTAMAVEAGVDEASFRECLSSGKYRDALTEEALSTQRMGVRGTPAFLINGVFVSGAQPFEVFQQIIEDQLQNE